MERCGGRRSFEKPRVEVPPARLQVIGFNVSPSMKAAETAAAARVQGLDMVSSPTASYNDQLSPSLPCKPASSPRSALQQLLLHQSLTSTSPTFSNQGLPPPHPPSISSNQNSTNGPLPPATSTPPPAANQKGPSGGLQLQLSTSPASAANQKWTSHSAISRPQSPPSAAYQSSGLLKSLLQSECSTSAANQSSRTSLSQSPYATSAGNQMINQHNAKPPKAVLIKENYEAFFQIKRTCDDGNDAKAHYELMGGLISAKELPHAAKSKKSSWLHDDDHDDDDDDDDDQPSAAEKCKKSSWKGVQQITEHSLGNGKSRKNSRSEEKSKKSSLFMFVASSPATDFHHHHHPAEQYDASKDMDFLSSCHLCRRLLGDGQDVFMYSGDKAFCSMECRYQQIVIDERKERCPPPIIRSGASPVFHHTSVTATTTHHPIMINNPHFINTAAAA